MKSKILALIVSVLMTQASYGSDKADLPDIRDNTQITEPLSNLNVNPTTPEAITSEVENLTHSDTIISELSIVFGENTNSSTTTLRFGDKKITIHLNNGDINVQSDIAIATGNIQTEKNIVINVNNISKTDFGIVKAQNDYLVTGAVVSVNPDLASSLILKADGSEVEEGIFFNDIPLELASNVDTAGSYSTTTVVTSNQPTIDSDI